jgi:hypothetical protein
VHGGVLRDRRRGIAAAYYTFARPRVCEVRKGTSGYRGVPTDALVTHGALVAAPAARDCEVVPLELARRLEPVVPAPREERLRTHALNDY